MFVAFVFAICINATIVEFSKIELFYGILLEHVRLFLRCTDT
jgi:hypothetical protein